VNCPNCGAPLQDSVQVDIAIVLDGPEGGEEETEDRTEAQAVTWDCLECGYHEKREGTDERGCS
jgi:RNase P subunit RPR2